MQVTVPCLCNKSIKLISGFRLHRELLFCTFVASICYQILCTFSRGMKFENVATLTDVLDHYIQQMAFHWCVVIVFIANFVAMVTFANTLTVNCRVDDSGPIMQQQGVFRVNCMDCLDRTNVVQAAIARDVLKSIVSYNN